MADKKKDGVGGGLVCAHCKKVGELGTMKRCGRCRLACYCSVECQKIHWKTGGHKKVCGKEGERGTSTDRAGASSGSDAPLEHPCPICLDSEDDAGGGFMCLSCGQMFCGSCKETLVARGVTHCPTCRAVLGIPPKEQGRLLRQLVARPDGRHTQEAQFLLGVYYMNGTGVAQDDAEALRWYRLAAEQGHVSARSNVGVCYATGTGVVQDATEAVRWFRLAADQGDAAAQLNLGGCYAKGTGVDQDAAEAARWYRLAADQGDADAQSTLGVCYAIGMGVDQDAAESVRWYRLAVDQGDADAQVNLGGCYLEGIGVVKDHAEAMRWLRLAADQGHAVALTAVERFGKYVALESTLGIPIEFKGRST
jgi:hypothetical protein